MVKKKMEVPEVRDFQRLGQVMEFFPARNLKADYITLQTGESLGAHRTLSRQEVIGVVQGIAQIVIDNEVYKLRKDQMIFIPRGKLCNLYNKNKPRLKIIFIKSKNNNFSV